MQRQAVTHKLISDNLWPFFDDTHACCDGGSVCILMTISLPVRDLWSVSNHRAAGPTHKVIDRLVTSYLVMVSSISISAVAAAEATTIRATRERQVVNAV